jgi:hypothetical protein
VQPDTAGAAFVVESSQNQPPTAPQTLMGDRKNWLRKVEPSLR